jgi:hypothetical protein
LVAPKHHQPRNISGAKRGDDFVRPLSKFVGWLL